MKIRKTGLCLRNFSSSTLFFQLFDYSMGAVSRAVDQYKNWPGRIEDYEPGRSSIAQNDNRVSHPQL